MNLATRIENAVAYIRSCTSAEPSFGMILGSGLGDFADTLENRQVIPFSDIPDFPAKLFSMGSTAASQSPLTTAS